MSNFLYKYLNICKIIFLLCLIFNLNLSLIASLPGFEQGVLHFEAGDKPAASIFFIDSLRKGNPLGYTYLNSMKSSGELVLPPEDEELFDNVPEICKEESSIYYEASILAIRRPKKTAKKKKKAGRAAARVERKNGQAFYLEGLRSEAAGDNGGAYENYRQSFEQKNLRAALGLRRLDLDLSPERLMDIANKCSRFNKGGLALADLLFLLRPMGFNINSVVLECSDGLSRMNIENISKLPVEIVRYFYLVFMRRYGISPEDLALAECNYAKMLLYGKGGPENREGARKYFLRAAEKELAKAEFYYGQMLKEGIGGDKDFKEARKYFLKATEKDDPDAIAEYSYGLMLHDGKGGDRDLEGAREYFFRAAEKGDANAETYYAYMLYNGEGGDVLLEEARKYYYRAAEKRDANAEISLSRMLYNGEGGDENLEEARKYFFRAAQRRDIEAEYHYAIMLYFGEGGDVLLEEAREYFHRAAEKGYTNAEIYYAQMLYKGEGRPEGSVGLVSPEDLEGAREYYYNAAKKGNALAEYNYGMILYRAEGKDKESNLEEAKRYFHRAMKSGFIPAQVLLNRLETDASDETDTEIVIFMEEEDFPPDDEDFSGEEEPLVLSAAGAEAVAEEDAVGEGDPPPSAAGAGADAAAAGAAGAGAVGAAVGAIKGAVKVVTINTGAGGPVSGTLCDDHSSLFAKLTPATLAFMSTTFGKDSTNRIVPYLCDDIIDLFERIQNYYLTSERKLVFKRKAKKDFSDLMSNPKTRIYAEKVLELIVEILRNPASKMGRPEKLRGELAGCMSRKISARHRLVYSLEEDQLEIIRCAGHYGRL
jgi:uncharacterized protein